MFNPLRFLYFRGPVWGGYGFWEGKPPEDICAEITSVGAHHWRTWSDECRDLLERKLMAFEIGIASVLCTFIIYIAITQCIFYYTSTRIIRNAGVFAAQRPARCETTDFHETMPMPPTQQLPKHEA